MHIKNITSAAALTFLVAAVPAMAVNTHANARTKATAQNGGWSASERAQAEQQFARFDRNGDGAITRDEFPLDASLFQSLDLNRDGAVTRAEIERAVPNRAAAERQVRAYDRNGDGVVTRDEFPGDATMFSRLDRNRDGVLSGSELRGKGRGNGKMHQE